VSRIAVYYEDDDGSQGVDYFHPMVPRVWSAKVHLVDLTYDVMLGFGARCGKQLRWTGWKDVGLANTYFRMRGQRPRRRMCRKCMTILMPDGSKFRVPDPADLEH